MAAIERRSGPASGRWIEQGPLDIRTERAPRELYVIELYGELALDHAGRPDALVDLSGLNFIDSSGLRVLYVACARNRENGNRLRLLRGSSSVDRVIKLTQMDSVLPFAD